MGADNKYGQKRKKKYRVTEDGVKIEPFSMKND
jgi:hypothetical protein